MRFLKALLFASLLAIASPALAAQIFITSGTTWTVPNDWNSSSNTVEVVGAGGGGGNAVAATSTGGGAAGGAYAKATNVSLTPGATVGVAIGTGGAAQTNGGASYLCNATSNCASIAGTAVVAGAPGGQAGSGATGGAGNTTGAVGGVKNAGGNGQTWSIGGTDGCAGGGAGGPNGIGGNGGSCAGGFFSGAGGGANGGGSAGASGSAGTTGGAGGNNSGSTGGGAGGVATDGSAGTAGGGGGGAGSNPSGALGGAGGNGIEWDASHGTGGGAGGPSGGSSSVAAINGANGGNYGGGASGGAATFAGAGTGGTGGNGIIIITYQPAPAGQNFGLTCPGNGALCNPRVCTYPLPSGSNTVASAYGFRRLRSAYAGKALNIVRASDSTTTDIGFDPDYCDPDIASMTTFCAGTTCKIVTWYDQSGNTVNVTQGTNSKRPGLTISCLKGEPCAAFASASSQELTGTLASGITNATYAGVASMTDLSAAYLFAAVGNNTNGTAIGYSSSSVACDALRFVSGAAVKATKTCSAATPYGFVGILRNSPGLSRIYLNSVLGTDAAIAGTVPSATAMNIGSENAINFFKGNVHEAILFDGAIADADALAVSANQQSYWGISR